MRYIIKYYGILFLFLLSINSWSQFTISLNIENVHCFAYSDGSAEVIVTGGVAPYSYVWSNGAGSAMASGLAAGNYSLTITDATFIDTIIAVEITEPDELTLFTGPDITICIGQIASLEAMASGGIPPYQYFWNPGGFMTGQIEVSPSVTTAYCVYARDVNNCMSDQHCVVVNVYPELTIELTASEDSILAGENLTLWISSTGGTGGPYDVTLFSSQGSQQLTTSSVQLSPMETTTYVVQVDDYCGTPSAFDSLTIFVDTTQNGLELLPQVQELKNSISIFPNPVTDWFSAEFNLNTPDIVQINLISSSGQVVFTNKAQYYPEGKHQCRLSKIPELRAGIYILKMETARQLHYTRLVKI
jgi:hypothetical protein